MNFQISCADVETLACCPLCGNCDLSTVSSVRDHSIAEFLATARCPNCSFVFRSVRPSKKWFSNAFKERENFQKDRGMNAINPDIETERYQRYFRLGKLLAGASGARQRTILDIGCGPGTGLSAFADLGFVASGIEEDRTRADHGIQLGLHIYPTQWEDFESAERYDVITCLHSIEHFHEPVGLLRKLKDWIKPGGRIVIEVPNFRYFVRDWTDSLYLAHMANYCPATLKLLAAKAGLQVVDRLYCYDTQAKNAENLCLVFESDADDSIEPGANDETPDWPWVASTYGVGLESPGGGGFRHLMNSRFQLSMT